ncbi:MAG: hypothetical protein HY894_07150 [Deltaproteobacteria bacterium]|nr:hypothetical protein [Deltaproteobacteria bacterium]
MLIAALSLLTGRGAYAVDADGRKTIDSTGYAVIYGDNALVARDAAIADALRKAVEQSVGTLVSSDTLVSDYQVLSDNVYTKSQGYVKEYKVIREGQAQNMYQATVTAVVAMGDIKNDLDALGLLMVKVEKPRVLFLITEKGLGIYNDTLRSAGSEADVPAAESTLKEAFLKKGFNIIDVSASTGKIDAGGGSISSGLSNDAARRIGRGLNAEIVVRGKAVAREGQRISASQVGVYLADITADVVRVDDGTVLASAKGHGAARNISAASGGVDALSKAADEIADRLIDQITAKWTSGNMVTIRVAGLADYRKAADFRNLLKKQVRGVTNVYQRRFEDGTAVFDMDVKATAQAIADDLARVPGAPVKITGTTQNTIEAVFQGPQ